MASGLLTAIKIWENFSVEKEITETILNEYTESGVRVKCLYISGRKVNAERVQIYAELIKKPSVDLNGASAIIVTQKHNDGMNKNLAIDLAKKGYVVLLVNQGGSIEGEQYGTIYPESIDYAYFDTARANSIEIEKTALDTCFYEWAVNEIYAYTYLKNNLKIKKIGALAIDEFANAVWQSATVVKFSCAVIISNAGWQGYRGINKFTSETEKPFSDNVVKYIAGVDAQSYALNAKCPILLLAPTHNPVYDVDRAYDTISGIKQNIYTAINYSLGSRFEVDYKNYQNAVLFLAKYLKGEEITLPKDLTLKADVEDGKILVEAYPDGNNLEKLTLFCSEDIEKSSLRSWQMLREPIKATKTKQVFEYFPYRNSSSATFFASAKYANGFRVCSNVICKKYAKEDICGNNRYRIIYSSKYEGGTRFFAPLIENACMPTGLEIKENNLKVGEKKGPYGIKGLCSLGGLITFKIGAEKFKPNDDEILMLDAFIEGGGNLEIAMVTDFFGDKKEYRANVKITGGIWQNIKLNINDFKLDNTMPLKSYSAVQAIEINSQNEFLINNVLWI